MKSKGSISPTGFLQSSQAFLRSLFLDPQKGVDDLLTPLPKAIAELEKRATDPVLRQKVIDYLGGDIPEYLDTRPILYLARHLATPNHETIRFSHLMDTHRYTTVIGQDKKDIFVPKNILKKTLGKLPIYTGSTEVNGKLEERYQKINIIDFNTAAGKPFDEIKTVWGEQLTDFHAGLCARFFDPSVRVVDDSVWIDRNGRGDLREHYKRFLSLFIVHGILFEDYLSEDDDEREFVKSVLRPAFAFAEKHFGVRPLITHLTPTSVESPLFWLSYSKDVAKIVEAKLNGK